MALSALRGGAAGAAASPDPLQSLMDLLRRRPSARASKKDHIKRVADQDIHLPGSDVQPLPELSAAKLADQDDENKGKATKLFFPKASRNSGLTGTEQPVLDFPRQSLKGVYAKLPSGSVLTAGKITSTTPKGNAKDVGLMVHKTADHSVKGTITSFTNPNYTIYPGTARLPKTNATIIHNYDKEPKMTAFAETTDDQFYVITDEARKVDGEDLAKDFGRMRVTMQELGNLNSKMVTETNRLDRIPPLEGVVKEFLACAKGLSYTYQADGAASGAARKRVVREISCKFIAAAANKIHIQHDAAGHQAFLLRNTKVKLDGDILPENADKSTVYTCNNGGGGDKIILTDSDGTSLTITGDDAARTGTAVLVKLIIQGEERVLESPVDEFDVHLFRPSKVSQAFQQLLAQDVLQDHEAFTVKDLLSCYLYFKTGYEVKDNVDTELKTLFKDNPHNNWYKQIVDFFPIRYELQRVLNTIDTATGLPAAALQKISEENLDKLFKANRPGGSTKACVQSLRAALDGLDKLYDDKESIWSFLTKEQAAAITGNPNKNRTQKIHTWSTAGSVKGKTEEFWTVLFRAVHGGKLQEVMDKMSVFGQRLLKMVLTFAVHVAHHFLTSLGVKELLKPEVIRAYDNYADIITTPATAIKAIEAASNKEEAFREQAKAPKGKLPKRLMKSEKAAREKICDALPNLKKLKFCNVPTLGGGGKKKGDHLAKLQAMLDSL